ncbi:hypothetical protein RB200_28940 [Streptomyces sp. PmtG]
MEFVGIALLVAGVLLPSVTKLLDSVAYRNRARGRAVIIRAERASGPAARGVKDGRTRGRTHG